MLYDIDSANAITTFLWLGRKKKPEAKATGLSLKLSTYLRTGQ